ncbi:MAG: macro domain-containing protein [Oscillospiraceae bacterium]|nr:macro domain-containing protein [Oscillospiraceae bacterium]
MPLLLVRNDITKMKCDAIVNAANNNLRGGGGVDGAIRRAAGIGLLAECITLGKCETGKAKVTRGYRLPCKYVIHAVGPIWKDGEHGEEELLRSAYKESLAIALKKGCESIAFPLISAGAYGYPKDKAMKVAFDCFSEFLLEHEMLIYLVIFDKESTALGEKLFPNIAKYIDDNYIGIKRVMAEKRRRDEGFGNVSVPFDFGNAKSECAKNIFDSEVPKAVAPAAFSSLPKFHSSAKYDTVSLGDSLEEALSMIDESFSEMLLRKIDEKGMTDAQCYKKANIDRKLFSKIRSTPNYHPKKKTALAFAVALELSLPETEELLLKAGYSLTKSSRFDIIVEYHIKNGIYDIFRINEALFSFDEDLLGP